MYKSEISNFGITLVLIKKFFFVCIKSTMKLNERHIYSEKVERFVRLTNMFVCACVCLLFRFLFLYDRLFYVVKFNLRNYIVGYISIGFTTNKLLYCSTLQRIHNHYINKEEESILQNFPKFQIEFTLLLLLSHGVLIY